MLGTKVPLEAEGVRLRRRRRVRTAGGARVATRVRRHGDALFPGMKGRRVTEWMGPRPSHPDSKPVIGRSPSVDLAPFRPDRF